jgi:hypothetical protein
MKKHLHIGLGCLTILSFGLVASAAFPRESFILKDLTTPSVVSITPVRLLNQTLISQSPSPNTLPGVDGSTWMTGENIPWSTPVSVWNSQGGKNYIAVFDRDYPTGGNVRQVRQMGEISNWNRRFIGLYGYGTQQTCLVVLFVPVCNTKHPIFPVRTATLKIGNRVFPLQGGNSQFTVDDELAYALSTAYPQKVLLRFTLADGSDTVTHPIGEATVKAWQTLYQNVPAPSVQPSVSSPSVPGETVPVKLPSDLVATLPVIDGATWRFTDDLPWSVPALVKDEFDGTYVAVFDRDYQKNDWNANESGLISNWGQKFIGLHIYEIGHGTTYRSFGVDAVDLKIGDRTFHLVTTNNQFTVTADLAEALRNAGAGQVQISFVNAQGRTITHPIGDRTINAWKTVYQAR